MPFISAEQSLKKISAFSVLVISDISSTVKGPIFYK